MAADTIAAATTQCNHCKKVSSPKVKIRACTRCFSVGYCSKNCQRADWQKHKKLSCKPSRMNETNNHERPSPQAAALEEAIDINSDAVRLETQCESGTWQDVGPIHLIRNNMCTHTNSSPSTRKELSPATKQILGQTANSFTYRHSHDGIDNNLVIFLHGAGDNQVPFDKLGQTMKLPQTATLSLSASMKMELPDSSLSLPKSNSNSTFVELPFGLGYTWFEEMDYQVTGDVLKNDHPRRLQSLGDATFAIDVLLSSLTDHSTDESSYWIPERVFLFGFSAGACLAMETCRLWKRRRNIALGGAICIGGGIKTESLPVCLAVNNRGDDQYEFTDVLIITGSKDVVYSQEEALKSKSCYDYDGSKVQIHIQQDKGHGMIESREEMQVLMEFLSKRLVRRMCSMEGVSEK
jgi:predicted esterase